MEKLSDLAEKRRIKVKVSHRNPDNFSHWSHDTWESRVKLPEYKLGLY